MMWAASVGMAALLCLVGSPACSLCNSESLRTVDSPTSVNRAFVYEVNCGATVDYSRQVTLAHDKAVPSAGVTESLIETGTVFRAGGRPDIQVQWESDIAVIVSYRLGKASDRVFKREPTWDGITVRFVELR